MFSVRLEESSLLKALSDDTGEVMTDGDGIKKTIMKRGIKLTEQNSIRNWWCLKPAYPCVHIYSNMGGNS